MITCQEARNAVTILEVECPQCGNSVEVFVKDGVICGNIIEQSTPIGDLKCV